MQPTPPRGIVLAFVCLALFPSLITASILWSNYPSSLLSPNRAPVVQDFIVMWVSGHMAMAGDLVGLSSGPAFNAVIAQLIGAGVDTYYWLYPPHMLLLAAPLALLPLICAWAVWVTSTAAFLWVVLRRTGLSVLAASAALASPAAVEDGIDGQNGAFLTAAMVGGLAFAESCPVLAGAFVSALSLKPQMALVVPLCLLVSRQFQALAWGAGFSALWVGGSILLFGSDPWSDYVTVIMPAAKALHMNLISVPFGTLALQNLVVTPFGAVRGLGGDLTVAYGIQTVASLTALAAVVFVWWPRPGRSALTLRIAAALALVPVATPYAMTYDMVCASVAVVILFSNRMAIGTVSRFLLYVACLTWFWPGISFTFGTSTGIAGLGAFAYAALAVAAVLAARPGMTRTSRITDDLWMVSSRKS